MSKNQDEILKDAEQTPELSRYSRQVLFDGLGQEGQRRLLASKVALIGCGGLGTNLANLLVRAGVGHLRIIDRDFIELNNLQRQSLYNEDDVAGNLPKAEAARRRLSRINSSVEIEAVVTDVSSTNIESLCKEADLLLDGADNFETRFLVNDLAVKTQRPWVYGACVGSWGLALPILPGETPCLRCLFEQAPPPELSPSCHTAGILGPVVAMTAAHQAMEAIKILAGRLDMVNRGLFSFDLWEGRCRYIDVHKAREEADCSCCKNGHYVWLSSRPDAVAVAFRDRRTVQITPPEPTHLDMTRLTEQLRQAGLEPRSNPFLLRVRVEHLELTVFLDGRAIIQGTDSPQEARSLYEKHVQAI